ncbi:hypothetical protein [Bradyrhizobium sp. CW10]|uniref:hypothetical protein n=1 Tax=Bradyrhizobium sp. CW10 TaxID=2782683 RepID=UPI001FF91598|nr:hypothetical protein [Bradyrhizobium sp. CW10]MCK1472370.1 hypothetical protein [Bradyrhizobium sp. CW10]
MKPLGGQPSFGTLRELARVVGSDCAIEIDTNATLGPCEAAAKACDGMASSKQRAEELQISPGGRLNA